ncbi:hypothetical protein [Streptomyces sp. AHA2]
MHVHLKGGLPARWEQPSSLEAIGLQQRGARGGGDQPPRGQRL